MQTINENEQNVTEIIQKITEKTKFKFKTYQTYGIKWAIQKEKIGGAIIADEMGLLFYLKLKLFKCFLIYNNN
jgi:SNF2 family DNA or RNA helicase